MRWCRCIARSATRSASTCCRVPNCRARERRTGRCSTQLDTSRTITVEFDANARGPWDFKPERASLQVHPGEMATVMYEFRNMQNRTMAAQAIPSYAPKQAERAFQQARVLLLRRIHARTGRIEALAGGLCHRPEAAQGRDDDHAVVHLLRSRRQGAGSAGGPHVSAAGPPPRRSLPMGGQRAAQRGPHERARQRAAPGAGAQGLVRADDEGRRRGRFSACARAATTTRTCRS